MAVKCTAKTKKGTACNRNAVTGLDVCIAHAPEELKDSQGFGGAQPGSGRPPTPRAVDVLKERIEEDIDPVLAPLWEGVKAEKAVVVGNGPTARVEYVPDIPTRIAATKELLDRGYGRPKQATEISSPDGTLPMLIVPADRVEKSTKAAELLKNLGQLPDAG